MDNKVQKYREELEKNEAKMSALKERGKMLEQKIREAESIEICALMRSENISMAELVALARSRKEGQVFPSIMDRQADATDEDTDKEQDIAMDQDTYVKRKEYMDDEEEEDEDDE